MNIGLIGCRLMGLSHVRNARTLGINITTLCNARKGVHTVAICNALENAARTGKSQFVMGRWADGQIQNQTDQRISEYVVSLLIR